MLGAASFVQEAPVPQSTEHKIPVPTYPHRAPVLVQLPPRIDTDTKSKSTQKVV
ncbi:hypothetical protein CY34DRAFT_810395 [Suillus luteus UH-Slu-Lm8-n1]|uniref:Uncharacterized protein n=1 Tax=Suillus luteus UH-Slu-Lm8-n1 TaxID=930992 RepID=A0A0D0AGV5_9AGAM|nr:hypothetical protein CY34DRAFT_810395 [Suillus luteus UH-Slu-Lm8-n1]